jgi:hypothetical protein
MPWRSRRVGESHSPKGVNFLLAGEAGPPRSSGQRPRPQGRRCCCPARPH